MNADPRRSPGEDSSESSGSALLSRVSRYRTAPLATKALPPGIGFIVANEAAERFSFYGMKGILVAFMTKHMRGLNGDPDYMTDAQARQWYHTFTMAVYLFPLLGALVSDAFLGKYVTILYFSAVYCCGHAVLAALETRLGLLIGLALIALGSGGIKPCVSAHVRTTSDLPSSNALFPFEPSLRPYQSTEPCPWKQCSSQCESRCSLASFTRTRHHTPISPIELHSLLHTFHHKQHTTRPPHNCCHTRAYALFRSALRIHRRRLTHSRA